MKEFVRNNYKKIFNVTSRTSSPFIEVTPSILIMKEARMQITFANYLQRR